MFHIKTLKPPKIISLQFSAPIPFGEESLFRPNFIATHNSRSSVTSNISCDFFYFKDMKYDEVTMYVYMHANLVKM